MKLISQSVAFRQDPTRLGKVAIFGTKSITKNDAQSIAKSLLNEISPSTKVFTVKSDFLGRVVRKICKDRGIRTYHLIVKHPKDENQEHLTVARLAWKVEKFYCIRSRQDKRGFAFQAMETSYRMRYLLKAVQLEV